MFPLTKILDVASSKGDMYDLLPAHCYRRCTHAESQAALE